MDILPVVLYGTGMIISKRQPFYVKRGVLCTRILPRIANTDTSFGVTYQERSKTIAAAFRNAYQETCDIYSNSDNPYFTGSWLLIIFIKVRLRNGIFVLKSSWRINMSF